MMKKYILTFITMLLLFPLFGEGNLLYAQRMASEGGSLWHEADKTGYYGIEHCDQDSCDFIACGTSEDEVALNMRDHYEEKHPELLGLGGNDNNWGFTDDGNNNTTGSNTSNNVNYKNLKYVVDLYSVAIEMEILGVCSLEYFLSNYTYGYETNNLVSISNMDRYIRKYFFPRSISLQEAVKRRYNVLMFSTTGAYEYNEKFLVLTCYSNKYSKSIGLNYIQYYVFY